MNKQYAVKIYTAAGAYVRTLAVGGTIRGKVTNEITFTDAINGAQGECILDLDLTMDDFTAADGAEQMYVAKIFEADQANSPSARLIYAGFTSKVTPYVHAGREGVRLILLGLGSLLAKSRYKNGAAYDVSVSGDPADVAKAIIDHFNTKYAGSWLGYAGGHVDAVGTAISDTYSNLTWLDALQRTLQSAGGGRWWRIGADGELWLKTKPAAATHTFTLGRDVQDADCEVSNEEVINQYRLIWGSGATVADFSDAASKTAYGERDPGPETDSNIGDATTAAQRGAQKIADNKDAKAHATLVVNSGYDIETIHPGDTCRIGNVRSGSKFGTNMLITSVRYTPGGAEIQCEQEAAAPAQQLAAAIRKLL